MPNFAVISSSSLGGHDNPNGRMDAGYNIFVDKLRRGDDSVTSQTWADLLPRAKLVESSGDLRQASTAQEIEAVLLAGLNLDPIRISAELRAGFRSLSRRIACKRISEFEAQVKETQRAIAELKSSILPT